MGPNYACSFVGYVKQQIREQYTGFIPQLHKRYIDDFVGAASCQRDELENFFDFVSNFHPALQFTSTISETELSFLDVNLRISEDRVHTSIFFKVTDTHNYLHFSSFHPDHCKRAIPYSQFLRLRRLCSDDDDFLVKSREMMTFFSQRCYPLPSLEHDLRRVRTIGRPDALSGSERGDTPVDSVTLVMTYHPFNTYIKRYLVQHFRILSTDQQTRDIFPQPPIVAYKRDVNLRDIRVYTPPTALPLSTLGYMHIIAPGVKPASSSLLSPIYGALKAPSPSAIISPALRKILCTGSPAADAPISTSEKLGEVSGVTLVSICGAYATTPLDFLWHNISTPPVTVFQMSRYEVCVCVEVRKSSANNWK